MLLRKPKYGYQPETPLRQPTDDEIVAWVAEEGWKKGKWIGGYRPSGKYPFDDKNISFDIMLTALARKFLGLPE